MEESTYLNPLRPQPVDGGSGTIYDGLHELVDYLPGTSMRFWYTSNPVSFGEHWHDCMEIVSCECGYYLCTVENTTYTINPKDVLIIPEGIVHTLSPMEDCRGYVHLIDLSPLKELKSSVTIQPYLAHPIFISQSENVALNQTVNSLLVQMQNEYFGNNDLRELLVYSHLFLLLTHIIHSHFNPFNSSASVNNTTQKEYVDIFKQILDYLSLHYAEQVTLEQLAKKYGFSKYHFSRLFGKYTNYNFCDYLAYQRINAAKSMLVDSSLTISEIAEKSGFNSLSTFNRVFKGKTGFSPSKYRQLYSQL